MYNLKGKTLVYKRWDTFESLNYNIDGSDFRIYKNLQPDFINKSHVFTYDGWDEPGNSKLMLFDKEYKSLQENGYFIGEFWVLILKD